MMEPTDVRLARIEEGIVALHGKFDLHHRSIVEKIKRVETHETEIALLKRDRWWIMSIAAAFGGAVSIAVRWVHGG